MPGADVVTAETAQEIADQFETGHDVAYSVLATDQGMAAWEEAGNETESEGRVVVIGRDEAVGSR